MIGSCRNVVMASRAAARSGSMPEISELTKTFILSEASKPA
jgi:hypothetical protein